MKPRRTSQDGMAILWALLAVLVILAAVTAVVLRVEAAKRFADDAVQQVALDEACKAGVDFAIEQVWHQYVVGNGNTTGNTASYRLFIDDLVSNNEDLNGNGFRDAEEADLDGNGHFDIDGPAVFIGPENPLQLANGATVTGVTVSRTDDLTG